MKKDKRKLILQIAREIFGKYGFKKTSVDEIAKKAHIGKGTIYYYYKSKEDIFKDVLEEEISILKKDIDEKLKMYKDPEEKLRIYVITRMNGFRKLSNFYSIFKDEYLEYYSFIEKIREKYLKMEKDIIKNILREGVKKKKFFIKNIELTSFAVVVAIKGFEYYWGVDKQVKSIERKINTLLDVFFNGIKKK